MHQQRRAARYTASRAFAPAPGGAHLGAVLCGTVGCALRVFFFFFVSFIVCNVLFDKTAFSFNRLQYLKFIFVPVRADSGKTAAAPLAKVLPLIGCG